jgi:hypothetical protein
MTYPPQPPSQPQQPYPGPGQPQRPYPGPGQPQQLGTPRPKRKTGRIVLACIGGLLIVGLLSQCISTLAGGGNGTAAPAPTVTVTETETTSANGEPAPTVTVTKTAPAPKPKPKPKPKIDNTMDEGTYEIGTDSQPGQYKTRVPQSSDNCYWERAKDDRGNLNSIIANDNLNPGARASVTVRRGEFFTSSGCGTWRKQ